MFHRELDAIRDNIPADVELIEVWLEQGLHREPERLNRLIKEEIAAAESAGEKLDAILLGYGICSQGTIGVSSDRYPIVIARAHDCITVFLGSKERYLEEFSRAPGTYWYTPGFMSGTIQPGMSEKYAGVYHEFEESYEKYLDKFGDPELAKYIIDSQEQAWIKNYSRGAYVDSGLPGGQAVRDKAIKYCKLRNWEFEEVRGDLGLLLDLVSGNWDSERFLVIEPGSSLVIGGVRDVITTDHLAGEDVFFGDDYQKSYVFDGVLRGVPSDTDIALGSPADVVIGIDAGGTYTDAAVVSLKKQKVLAASKSNTTHHDLSIGIRKAIEKLPDKLVQRAERLVISTTLATNSIVEERGSRTSLILIGYGEDTAAMVTIGSGDSKDFVPGCHDIYGVETIPLDEERLLRVANDMVEAGAEALAVSSYMGTRNPRHEIRAAELLGSRYDIPVVTGHELTTDIDSVRRAHTVLLNARLLPVIDQLVQSMNQVVRDLNLPTDVRIVTTEGSLMNTEEARSQPVRMILSGPAASVMGVRFLTDISSCVLLDMGGTTTDIAAIEGGSARRTGRGAYVGNYKTSVNATDIRTVGLGGDSGIRWVNGNLVVGPYRVVPISRLASEHEKVKERLRELRGFQGSDYGLVQPATFYLRVLEPGNSSFLTERERMTLKLLRDGPLSEVELAEIMDYPYYSLLGMERLENLGIIRRSGLTPTDLMIIDGRKKRWDREAAELLIGIYVERTGLSPEEFIRQSWAEIYRVAASAVLTETMSTTEEEDYFPGCRYCRKSFDVNGPVDITYTLKTKLVGVGAPTKDMLEGLDGYLKAEKVFPRWAEVANAVGAASGAGGMHIDMLIMPEEKGGFMLYTPMGMYTFRSLDHAKTEAIKLSEQCAMDYAKKMGYDAFSLNIRVRDRSVKTGFDSDIFLDTSVVSVMKY